MDGGEAMNEDDMFERTYKPARPFKEQFEDVDGFYRREALFLRACFQHCKLPIHLGLSWYCPQLFEGPSH